MSLFNDTLDALWTILDADEAFAALMTKGTKYKLASGEMLRPLLYEPAWCPILAIAPEPDGSQWPPARRDRGPGLAQLFAVRVEGATSGQARAPVLALSEGFYDAIAADMVRVTGSKLKALGVNEVDFQGLSFEPRPGPNDVIETWSFRVTCLVKYRVS